MINSVSTNSMAMMRTSSMQRQPPPADKDVFKVTDSDSNGQVSSTELKTLVAGIEKITGNSLDVEETLSTYDSDGDGSLNGEELFGLMSSQGFTPFEMIDSEEGSSGMRPPPPPADQVSSAYQANSSDDSISQLIELLRGGSASEEGYSSLELTA